MTGSATKLQSLDRNDWVAVGVAVLLGVLSLPLPIGGDQALFLMGARQISEGAVLYRDFWEINQPGIYAFNLLAGSLFGFTEVGIRLAELALMTGFSVFAVSVLKRRYLSSAGARLVPVLSVGLYYAIATSGLITQKEGLVGPLLFALLWVLVHKTGSRSSMVTAGVLSAAVVILKLLYAPLVGVFWILGYFAGVRTNSSTLSTLVRDRVVPLLIGFVPLLFAVPLYFAVNGAMGEFLEATFVIPSEVISLHRQPIRHLVESMQWYLAVWAPLLALAFVGVATRGRPLDHFTHGLVWWYLLGGVILLVQTTSWWKYHFLLLLVPTAVLAARGVDQLKVQGMGRLGVGIALLVALSSAAGIFSFKTFLIAKSVLTARPLTLEDMQADMNPDYRLVREEVEFLRHSERSRDRLYVLGNPRYQYLARRNQPIPLNGWSPEYFLPRQWPQLGSQLERAKPDHVFVAHYNLGILEKHGREVAKVLEAFYSVREETEQGVWYELNGERE